MQDELALWRYAMDGRRVIFRARQVMDEFGGSEMSSEHLVLGLLDEDVAASRDLANLTLPKEELKEWLVKPLLSRGRPEYSNVAVSAVVREILRHACEEADRLGHEKVFSSHILLGVLLEGTTDVARYLMRYGQDAQDLRRKLRERKPMEEDE